MSKTVRALCIALSLTGLAIATLAASGCGAVGGGPPAPAAPTGKSAETLPPRSTAKKAARGGGQALAPGGDLDHRARRAQAQGKAAESQ
jgi:hypothetical protein